MAEHASFESTRSGSTGVSSGIGRELDEAGSQKREHPAAGMERPSKWQKDKKPSLAEVSIAEGKAPIRPDEVKKLESAGLKEVSIFLANDSQEQILSQYRAKLPRAKVSTEKESQVLSGRVSEGRMMVTLTPTKQNETLVCEFLIPASISANPAEWVRGYQAKAEQQ